MRRMQFYRLLVMVLCLQPSFFGLLFGQTEPYRPLNPDQVEEYWKTEKAGTFDRGYTKQKIQQLGVMFELDFALDQRFRKAGMPQSLLDTIRSEVRTATLTVQCEPVECDVTINHQPAGTTFASILTKAQIMPGLVTVNVTAPNFEPQTAEVEARPGQHLTVAKFKLQPQKGALIISCNPPQETDCSVRINGPNGFEKKAITTQHRFAVEGLPSGEYEIEAAASEYFPKTDKVWIVAPKTSTVHFDLKRDEWIALTPLQVFDRVVDSLGGKAILTAGATSKNSARMSLIGDPVSIGTWREIQVGEYAVPSRLRWELRIGGSNWNILADGGKVYSKGDKKYAGTEFALELEQSIRVFSTLRLPAALAYVRAKLDIQKDRTDTEFIMIGESADDRYTFHLNKDYLPLRLLHEHLAVPQSREEIEFAQYRSIGRDLMLPHVMILRYPDRPNHQQILQYDTIDLDAVMKPALFKP